MPALLIVRATPPATERAAFDHWYETDHLPKAHAAFGSLSARRGWTDADPPVHLALYEFDTPQAARAAAASDAMTRLRAEFDAAFPEVPRAREIVDLI